MGLCFIFKPCPVSNIYYASKAHKYKNNLSFFFFTFYMSTSIYGNYTEINRKWCKRKMEGKKTAKMFFFSLRLLNCFADVPSVCTERNNADLFFYYYFFFGEVCVVTCCLTFDCNRSQCYLVTIHHLSILQLENLFFLFSPWMCCVFSLVLCLCLKSVGERNIDQVFFCVGPMALSQSRWTCWLGLSPRLFGRVLMILCVWKKVGVLAWSRIGSSGLDQNILAGPFFLTAVHCSL